MHAQAAVCRSGRFFRNDSHSPGSNAPNFEIGARGLSPLHLALRMGVFFENHGTPRRSVGYTHRAGTTARARGGGAPSSIHTPVVDPIITAVRVITLLTVDVILAIHALPAFQRVRVGGLAAPTHGNFRLSFSNMPCSDGVPARLPRGTRRGDRCVAPARLRAPPMLRRTLCARTR